MRTNFFLLAAFIVAVGTSFCSADIVWTGASDNNIQNDLNYNFAGSALNTVFGIEGSALQDNLVYNNSGTAPELPNSAGQLNYGASAFSLTFNNVITTFAAGSNEGWSGATVSLINGARTTSFFYVNSVISMDATSSMFLLGGGNPVNLSTINMAPGAVVTFTAEDVAAFTAEHLTKFSVNGSAGVIGSNLSVVSDGAAGSIVTAISAIPEPSSFTLFVGIAGMFVSRRRRR